MAGERIDYSTLFNKSLPSPSGKWQGHPKYNFIGGHSDPDLVPMNEFIESAANVFKGDPRNIAMYNFEGGPQGILSLRNFLVSKLSAERGIDITSEEILITSGSGQAIELINEILLDEGDTVIVESFTFSGALSYLRRRGVNFVGVDLDENGIRMDQLENILADLKVKGIRPKYIYTIPTLQNPTGTVMTMERRHRLLDLSEEYGVPIFEDESGRMSSSRIRSALNKGELAIAKKLMGRAYRFRGKVKSGRGLGRKLGWPTANLEVNGRKFLPGLGVYAAWAWRKNIDTPFSAIMNLGPQPTIDPCAPSAVEVHILGENLDLKGCELVVEPVRRLRGQKRFGKLEELTRQIGNDAEKAKSISSSKASSMKPIFI